MRASGVAAGFLSAVILAGCLVGVIAQEQQHDGLWQRLRRELGFEDVDDIDFHEDVDYSQYGGPQPERIPYNYGDPPYGSTPPTTSSGTYICL